MTDTMISQNIDLSSWDTLYNRLGKIIELEIGNYQMGFRRNTSTIDTGIRNSTYT